jgi:hypothetical protein
VLGIRTLPPPRSLRLALAVSRGGTTRPPLSEQTIGHGAVMEQSGRNRRQRVANETDVRTAQRAKNRAAGCDQLPIRAHGKKGIDGSSPTEGSAKAAEIAALSVGLARTSTHTGRPGGRVNLQHGATLDR